MTYPQGHNRGWDPLGELQSLRSELSRLVGLVGGGRAGIPSGIDLHRAESGWTITAALPGVAPEEVAIELDDREMCIRARTEAEVNEEIGLGAGGSQQRSFEYRVAVPADVDADKVDATMDHGLLTVHLPTSSRGARRTITIGQRGAATATGGRAGTPAPIDGDPAADRELHHHHHPHGGETKQD